MRLALALYASTAHANTPHCDLDRLYHDKERIGWLAPPPLGFLAAAHSRVRAERSGRASSRHD